jgi:hypothetical protein
MVTAVVPVNRPLLRDTAHLEGNSNEQIICTNSYVHIHPMFQCAYTVYTVHHLQQLSFIISNIQQQTNHGSKRGGYDNRSHSVSRRG